MLYLKLVTFPPINYVIQRSKLPAEASKQIYFLNAGSRYQNESPFYGALPMTFAISWMPCSVKANSVLTVWLVSYPQTMKALGTKIRDTGAIAYIAQLLWVA